LENFPGCTSVTPLAYLHSHGSIVQVKYFKLLMTVPVIDSLPKRRRPPRSLGLELTAADKLIFGALHR